MKSTLLLGIGGLVALAIVAIFAAGWLTRMRRRQTRKRGKRVFDDLV